MTEDAAIERATRPATAASLTDDLQALGLSAGDVAIVHSSLSAIGWTTGGPQAVVESLLAVVGDAGTIVMPTQSAQLSDPAGWEAPPVPTEWHETIREHMPAYDRHLTPTRSMGVIVDCFLRHPDTRRSDHPSWSFGANGSAATEIVGRHEPADGFGDDSPLGRLYDLDASILFLGTTHENNTSLHLAEARATWPSKAPIEHGAPMIVDGERRWFTWEGIDPDEEDFVEVGAAYAEAGGAENRGTVGVADARLIPMRPLVDFATPWMSANR